MGRLKDIPVTITIPEITFNERVEPDYIAEAIDEVVLEQLHKAVKTPAIKAKINKLIAEGLRDESLESLFKEVVKDRIVRQFGGK